MKKWVQHVGTGVYQKSNVCDVSNKNYRIEDLLTNDSFIDYALSISESSISYWEEQMKVDSKLKIVAQKAKDVILFQNKDLSLLDEIEMRKLKDKVFLSI